MHTIQSTRGPFVVCDACFSVLKQERMVDERGRAIADDISGEFCPNCFDRNKVLIDDLAGSTE
jgi:hypothetical protein